MGGCATVGRWEERIEEGRKYNKKKKKKEEERKHQGWQGYCVLKDLQRALKCDGMRPWWWETESGDSIGIIRRRAARARVEICYKSLGVWKGALSVRTHGASLILGNCAVLPLLPPPPAHTRRKKGKEEEEERKKEREEWIYYLLSSNTSLGKHTAANCLTWTLQQLNCWIQ